MISKHVTDAPVANLPRPSRSKVFAQRHCCNCMETCRLSRGNTSKESPYLELYYGIPNDWWEAGWALKRIGSQLSDIIVLTSSDNRTTWRGSRDGVATNFPSRWRGGAARVAPEVITTRLYICWRQKSRLNSPFYAWGILARHCCEAANIRQAISHTGFLGKL